jgi:hypothetical protein
MDVFTGDRRIKNGHKALDYVNDKVVIMSVCSPIIMKIYREGEAPVEPLTSNGSPGGSRSRVELFTEQYYVPHAASL